MRNVGRFQMSVDFLIERLGLPDDTTIIGANFDPMTYRVEIILSHPDIPNTPELDDVPRIMVQAKKGVFEKWRLS